LDFHGAPPLIALLPTRPMTARQALIICGKAREGVKEFEYMALVETKHLKMQWKQKY
jgi:hypothetical protein